MDQQFQFNLVQLVVMLALTLVVGGCIASLYFSVRLKQADAAVDYIDDMLQQEYELNRCGKAIMRFLAKLPSNSRHWTTEQRQRYTETALFCAAWFNTEERAS